MTDPAEQAVTSNAGILDLAELQGEIPAQRLMRRETRVRYAAVPHTILDHPLPEMNWQLKGERFLLRAVGDHYFYYEVGAGVVVERGSGALIEDEPLWLNGSVYAAVASLNGLLPIHASAVTWAGRVVAFTGPAGAGKSTLVAALGALGLPMFCDDTLVLDLSDPTRIVCLPGHKRLKLTAEALAATGATPEGKVSTDIDKFFAVPAGGEVREPLPLGELIFLEERPRPLIRPINGAECFVRVQDDHYTAAMFAEAHCFGREEAFRHYARLANQIPMSSFARPRSRESFQESVAVALEHVRRSV